jgi:hypothetical protein
MHDEQVSLSEFIWEIATSRSFGRWREVRPTRREALGVVVLSALALYILVIVFDSGIGSHCLWDKFGSRCENQTP